MAGKTLACSAGVFIGRLNGLRKRHVESTEEKEMGRVKGSGEGVGRKKSKVFFPLPPPLSPSFAVTPTLRVTISTLPNLPLS